MRQLGNNPVSGAGPTPGAGGGSGSLRLAVVIGSKALGILFVVACALAPFGYGGTAAAASTAAGSTPGSSGGSVTAGGEYVGPSSASGSGAASGSVNSSGEYVGAGGSSPAGGVNSPGGSSGASLPGSGSASGSASGSGSVSGSGEYTGPGTAAPPGSGAGRSGSPSTQGSAASPAGPVDTMTLQAQGASSDPSSVELVATLRGAGGAGAAAPVPVAGVAVKFYVAASQFAGAFGGQAPEMLVGTATTSAAGVAQVAYRTTWKGTQSFSAQAAGTGKNASPLATAAASYDALSASRPFAGQLEASRPDGTVGRWAAGLLLAVVALLWIVMLGSVGRVHLLLARRV